MRTAYDFSPLFRSSVGFDRVFDLLENAARVQAVDNWPPYNIEKAGEDQYRITMAVAGFSPDELDLTAQPNLLVVSGRQEAGRGGHAQYLHRGIATRSFERRFELADHVKVTGARLDNGLLTIELVREVPEEMKPRRIEVQAWQGLGAAEGRGRSSTRRRPDAPHVDSSLASRDHPRRQLGQDPANNCFEGLNPRPCRAPAPPASPSTSPCRAASRCPGRSAPELEAAMTSRCRSVPASIINAARSSHQLNPGRRGRGFAGAAR